MASYCFKLSWKWLINIIKSTMGCIFYNPCLFLAIKGALHCPLWRTQKHLLYLKLSEITAVGVFCFTTTGGSNKPLLYWYYKNKAGIIIMRWQETVGDRPAAATNGPPARKLLLGMQTVAAAPPGGQTGYWQKHQHATWLKTLEETQNTDSSTPLIVQHCAQQHSQRSRVRQAVPVSWPRPQTHIQRISVALTLSGWTAAMLLLNWNTETLSLFFNW